jgi:tellurite methyltransferase
MNKNYWKEFYKINQPTKFAKLCIDYLDKNSFIVDVGCGNGRDTKYFKSLDIPAIGCDFASDCDLRIPLKELISIPRSKITVIYSRFFLQCLSNKEIIDFIHWTKDRLFMAEFRIKGDVPKIFADHKRNFVDMNWLKEVLKNKGFDILYFKSGRNLAKYKQENPLVGRIIARGING